MESFNNARHIECYSPDFGIVARHIVKEFASLGSVFCLQALLGGLEESAREKGLNSDGAINNVTIFYYDMYIIDICTYI